jgi:hypothetical protein
VADHQDSPDGVPPIAEPDPARVAAARPKFPCAACGAEARWNPATQRLVCPYCGTESAAANEAAGAGGPVREHPLPDVLRSLQGAPRGWEASTRSVRCQSCRAISVFDAATIGKRCEFCGSSAIVPYEETDDPFRPESVLPLAVTETQAREGVRAWRLRQWLAPTGFSAHALTDTLRCVYLPYWTFDATADARWTAESGEYYDVVEGGRRVQRTRWTAADGRVTHRFDDELVPAALGVDRALLRSIEPFPTDTLTPYSPAFVAGWTVERYQIDLVSAATRVREQMLTELRAVCGREVPGDTYRNLSVDAAFSAETFKHILAPVWLVSYIYRGRTLQTVVNGVTGSVAGQRPWSWVKVGALVVLGLFLLYLWAISQ